MFQNCGGMIGHYPTLKDDLWMRYVPCETTYIAVSWHCWRAKTSPRLDTRLAVTDMEAHKESEGEAGILCGW
jgi:hypothetical protein